MNNGLHHDLRPAISVFGRADHRHPAGADAGRSTASVCRKHGISSGAFYKWKSKFGGADVSAAKRLRSLENENRKLKKLLAGTCATTRSRRM